MFGFKKDMHNVMNINIPNRVVIRVMLVVVVTLIGFSAVRQASHAITLICTAFFLALALNAPVHWIAERLPGKRKPASWQQMKSTLALWVASSKVNQGKT